MTIDLAALQRALEVAGFRLCGAFHPQPDDGVPLLADGRPAHSLLLIGHAGPQLWRQIRLAPEANSRHPFDHYTRRVVGGLARTYGGTAFFPFDGPPWLPFQRWARRAEPGLEPAPLGMLIHPRYGLWHAYRAALGFAEKLELPQREPLCHPCRSCDGRPCLDACPAAALSEDGYDVEVCRAYLARSPGCACLTGGCLARHACPVGRAFAYDAEQAAHHMRAFAGGV